MQENNQPQNKHENLVRFSETMRIRLEPELLELIKKAAAQNGKKMSVWVREQLLKGVGITSTLDSGFENKKD